MQRRPRAVEPQATALKRPPLAAIDLPLPGAFGGASVLSALERRRTTRTISERALSLPLLGTLLWAAYGVNRRNGSFGQPGRTAASASNSQEIAVYVATKDATYRYDALGRRLLPIASGDLRAGAQTPGQRGIEARAPIQLIYVADLEKLAHTAGYREPSLEDPVVQQAYAHVDTGLIAGNVYLFAAAEGLAAWFHSCDKQALAKALSLGPNERVLFAQSVGYPAPP
jgi:nitroreductase